MFVRTHQAKLPGPQAGHLVTHLIPSRRDEAHEAGELVARDAVSYKGDVAALQAVQGLVGGESAQSARVGLV